MKRIFALLFAVLIITGCSTNKPIENTAELNPLSWGEHVDKIKQIKNWQNNARIAIKIKDKTQTASMQWQQQQDQFKIEFSGPFGQQGLELTGNNKSATLNIAKEAPITGKNTSAILRKRLGWDLPVENVKYWILGLPSPLSQSKATLKNERLTALTQDGWNVLYPKYKKFGEHFLPSKIIISKDDTRFLIAIYKWNTLLLENQL